MYRVALQENRTNLRFEDYTNKLCFHSNTQAGGYLAEPQSLEQMEFLAGIAGLESDFTGIRNVVPFSSRYSHHAHFVQKLVDWTD